MSVQDRSDAYAMIAEEGQAVTLTHSVAGAYDPASGSASQTITTQSGKGVILPLSAGVKYLGGTNIPKGAKQCLLAADGTIAPQVGDKLTDTNGAAYTVVEVSPLEPAGMALLYDLTIAGVQ